MIYVRWKKGESRRGRVFPPLAQDHPLFDLRCVVCEDVLGTGEEIQLVAVGVDDPDDEEEFERYETGRWFSAAAVALHRRDVDRMSDADLDALVADLVIVRKDFS